MGYTIFEDEKLKQTMRKTLANNLSFLKELYKFFDCRIQSILTDNVLEFTNIRGA